jgi:hypothetical protein
MTWAKEITLRAASRQDPKQRCSTSPAPHSVAGRISDAVARPTAKALSQVPYKGSSHRSKRSSICLCVSGKSCTNTGKACSLPFGLHRMPTACKLILRSTAYRSGVLSMRFLHTSGLKLMGNIEGLEMTSLTMRLRDPHACWSTPRRGSESTVSIYWYDEADSIRPHLDQPSLSPLIRAKEVMMPNRCGVKKCPLYVT